MFRRKTYPETDEHDDNHGADDRDDHPTRDNGEYRDEPPPRDTTEYRESGPGATEVARPFVGLISSLIIVSLLVVEVLLGTRLGFQLAEANPESNFVEFIYDTSGPLVEPFSGIMTVEVQDDGGVFDPNILIAMAVYLVAGILALAVLWALTGPFLNRRRGTPYDSYDQRQMHQH
jgi:hypothetical protein